ncbi:MAG: glycosyltransferase family 4 protein [Bacteroidetes bacterium]|nr:glycosyltransferase family 4 protein [Bacteroidota bacterium]MBS1540541.1 glycosyltransferase family 4 protein [Bacteroidota bacterium]
MHGKKKIIIISPYPFGEAPSQRFRFEQYLDHLAGRGTEVTVKPFLSLATWRILYQPGNALKKAMGVASGFINRFFVLFTLPRYDFVFVHREATPIGPPVFEWIVAKIFRKKIIYDFDDAIWLPNTSSENKIIAWLKWHGKVKSICRWSYRISCGNEFLAGFAKKYNRQVTVNPTTIDTEHLHQHSEELKRKNEKVIIGWTGTHSTLLYLSALQEVFLKLADQFKDTIGFLIIADKPPDMKIEFEFVKWSKENEMKDLLKMDIGVMPLPDNDWAKGKCGFKALQYMALEIATVASPVGVNSSIIAHEKDGLLCSTSNEWYAALSRLIEDASLREKIGKAGRAKVVSHYSVVSNSSNFLSLFE